MELGLVKCSFKCMLASGGLAPKSQNTIELELLDVALVTLAEKQYA